MFCLRCLVALSLGRDGGGGKGGEGARRGEGDRGDCAERQAYVCLSSASLEVEAESLLHSGIGGWGCNHLHCMVTGASFVYPLSSSTLLKVKPALSLSLSPPPSPFLPPASLVAI